MFLLCFFLFSLRPLSFAHTTICPLALGSLASSLLRAAGGPLLENGPGAVGVRRGVVEGGATGSAAGGGGGGGAIGTNGGADGGAIGVVGGI